MAVELLVLRLVHVLGGIFWVGAGLFSTFYLGPALKAAGPAAAGAVMVNMQQRKLFQVMPTVAILTILSGARLMMIVSGGDSHWFTHPVGHTYAISAALAVVALLLGIIVVRPSMARAGRMSQEMAAAGANKEQLGAQVAKIQRRAMLSSTIATICIVLAAAGMAIARYM